MTASTTPQVHAEIQVSRRHLKQSLDAMDVSESAVSRDRACLFCRDGQSVIRQGYTERTVLSDKSFPGQLSFAFTSVQKLGTARSSPPFSAG